MNMAHCKDYDVYLSSVTLQLHTYTCRTSNNLAIFFGHVKTDGMSNRKIRNATLQEDYKNDNKKKDRA